MQQMVRTISTTLQAAIGATTRRPAIKLEARDTISHLNNSLSTPGNQTGLYDGYYDMCVANDGSIIRVRVTWGGGGADFVQSFQWQRITDPTNATQWTTWNTFSGGNGNISDIGGCAISNNGSTIRAFAQQGTGGNALWNWFSTDGGQTWPAAPGVVLSPPGNALIKGIGSAGNNDVFFQYDVLGGEALAASFYNGAAWGALVSANGILPLTQSGAGIAVIWSSGPAAYTLAYSDNFIIYGATYTPGSNTWAKIGAGFISPGNNQTGFSNAVGRYNPRISAISGVYYLTSIDYDGGYYTQLNYSYLRVRQSVDLVNWSNGFILHDMPATYGGNIVQTTPPVGGGRAIWVVATALKVEYGNAFSQSDTTQYVDLSAYVLEYHRIDSLDKPALLTVLLDNSNNNLSQYVSAYSSSYKPIGINTTLILSEGYYTGTPPTNKELVQVGQYHVKQIAFQRAPGEHRVQIVAEDISRYFDYESRYQYAASNISAQTILQQVCVLSGVLNYNIPALSQLQTNIITFVIKAGNKYRAAINELARVGWVEYFIDQNEVLQVKQLNANDPVVWSYNPEIETLVIGNDDENINHVIVAGKPPNGPLVPLGSVTEGEAYDDTNIHVTGLEKFHIYTDPKLANATLCQNKAAFLLQQEQRDLIAHAIAVPANPALQLLDVVSITDQNAPTGTGKSANARIWKQEVVFNAENAEFEQTLYLEGV